MIVRTVVKLPEDQHEGIPGKIDTRYLKAVTFGDVIETNVRVTVEKLDGTIVTYETAWADQ